MLAPRMAGLNLRGEPTASEEPPLSEEPLGLDLIRGWLAKPRPRLYRLWLWVPLTARGVRKAHGWLRANAGPALRRTARTLREAAAVAHALRRAANRLKARLESAFPPGSRGREVAGHLADGSRLLLRSALLLVGLGREAERLPSVFERGRAPRQNPPEREHRPRERLPEPERPPAGAAPEPAPGTAPEPTPGTPDHAALDEPGTSTAAGPAGQDDDPAASPGPAESGDPAASPGPAKSPTNEVSQPAPSPPGPSPPEPSESEPAQSETVPEDPPDPGAAEPAPDDPSPVPGFPAGPRADALAKLSTNLRVRIRTLGKRPRKAVLRYTVWWILDESGAKTSEELGLLLEIDPANLAKRHLSPLVEQGVLERTIPDRINHPDQAYRATGRPPGAAGLPPVGE